MNLVNGGANTLEVLHRGCATPVTGRPPILFVHGGFTAAWCWQEHFLDWFATQGHEAYALSLRGHGGSAGRDALHSFGIDDYVEDVASVAQGLADAPILVGHSMGGFIVQKYLESHHAAGAVLLAPVPASGLAGPGVAMAATNPALFWDLGMIHEFGSLFANVVGMHEVLFTDGAPDDMVRRYGSRLSEESHRAWLDMSGFNLPLLSRIPDVPMLVIGGERDTIIPPAFVRSAARLLGTSAEILPGLGHALMLEPGWESVAARIDGWIAGLSHGGD